MKPSLLNPAFTAILGLALASAPLCSYAQTATPSASTAPAAATSTNTAPKPTRTGGLVTAVDASGNTISVQNKKDGVRMFSIASTAKITKDKKPATLADFAVGDTVSLTFSTDASGTLTATTLSKTSPVAPRTSGTITAVDATANTISIKNTKDGTRTFAVSPTAKITKDKQPATLADFAVNDKVYISYNKDASGNLTAVSVSKTTPKTKAPSSSTAPPAVPAAGAAPATTTTSNM